MGVSIQEESEGHGGNTSCHLGITVKMRLPRVWPNCAEVDYIALAKVHMPSHGRPGKLTVGMMHHFFETHRMRLNKFRNVGSLKLRDNFVSSRRPSFSHFLEAGNTQDKGERQKVKKFI